MKTLFFICLILISQAFSEKKGIGWSGYPFYKHYLNEKQSLEITIDPGLHQFISNSSDQVKTNSFSLGLGFKYLWDISFNDLFLMNIVDKL